MVRNNCHINIYIVPYSIRPYCLDESSKCLIINTILLEKRDLYNMISFILTTVNAQDSFNLFKFIEDNWFQITLIISVVASIYKVSTKINDFKYDNQELHKELKKDIENVKNESKENYERLEKRIKDEEDKRDSSSERTKLIMEGVEATLISLHNQGCNGPVTESLAAINEYKTKKASEG